MPLVEVKIIEGELTKVQKQEMIEKLTDATVSIMGENLRQLTWVVIDEVKSGGWGIGGELPTPDYVRALSETLTEASRRAGK